MRHYRAGCSAIFFLCIWASTTCAETVITPSVNTTIRQTEDLQSLADRWQLDTQEYERYLDLMKGPIRYWNPNLDPLLVLGMFAENSQQEQRYAELYAQQEFELTERTLKFQLLYRDAFNRLYTDVGIIEQRLLAPYFQHEQTKSLAQDAIRSSQQTFESGDQLLLFASQDCADCGSLINHLSNLLVNHSDTRLDVYVLGATSDENVREWAADQGIGLDWLRNERITLNRDEGLFQRLKSHSSNPAVEALPIYLRRNGQYFQLSSESLAL